MSSCASATSQTPEAGYHTPIEEDELAPLTPAAGSLIQQAPSPFSAIMTVSLEGYLEPQRISFSSPPNSELNPRAPSPDDSYPVFSPPPYDAAPTYAEAVNVAPPVPQRQISLGPPWMNGLHTPRQSVISYSSRSPMSHHTCNSFVDLFSFCFDGGSEALYNTASVYIVEYVQGGYVSFLFNFKCIYFDMLYIT